MFIIIITLSIFLFSKDNCHFTNPYEVKASPKDNFLFLGDSITERYSLEEYYDNLPVVNSGISGNKTTDILSDMKGRIYHRDSGGGGLWGGAGGGGGAGEEIVNITFNNIKEIIKEIRENRGDATIYVESVYPINSTIENTVVTNRTNKKVKALNKKLSDYCYKENCNYINLYDTLTDDEGNLKEEYTEDGLHLNSLGYVVITRELLPYLNE